LNSFDVVIVGSGAGGAAAAWRYASRGLSVCVVEQGSWKSASQSPVNDTFGEVERFGKLSPLPTIRKDPWNTSVDSAQSEIEISFFEGVGGSTLIYSGHFPRFRAIDFEMKTRQGVGSDWPISYADIVPYYELNETRMNVAGLLGDPRFPEITSLGPPVPIGLAGERLSSSFQAAGWHVWPSYGAFKTSPSHPSTCKNLGSCNLGCPNDAKATAVNGYLSDAISMGAVVRSEQSVVRVLEMDGVCLGVEVRDRSGRTESIRARWTVLAGGTVGTTKVLLRALRDLPEFSRRSNRQLIGKNLMLHPLGMVEAVFDEELDIFSGPEGSWLYSLEFDFDYQNSKPGFMMQMLRGVHPSSEAIRKLQLGKIEFGANFGESALSDLGKTFSIAIVAEDLPEERNKLTLDSENSNLYGTEGIAVHYSCSPGVKDSLKLGLSKAREVLLDMGARRIRGVSPVRASGWHPSGTAVFGLDPRSSVCNEVGMVRGLDNLFVSDASVFPTGSCLNPTNTIQSLSVLLADRILEQHG